MKYIIRFISYLPALGTGVSAILLFLMSFDAGILIPLYLLDMVATVYLADNASNIAYDIEHLIDVLSGDN